MTVGSEGLIWSAIDKPVSVKRAPCTSGADATKTFQEIMFAPTTSGLEALRVQILKYRKLPVALTIDLPDEQFELVVLSALGRGSRKPILTAMAAQRFPDADLVGASVCPGKNSDGRVRALLLGVRGNPLLRATMRTLECDGIRVRGIYSLPRLVAFFSRTAVGEGPALIMSWSGQRALRQTAVSAGGLIASRVVSRTSDPESESDFTAWLQSEVDRFTQTLANRDLLPLPPEAKPERVLEVGFLSKLVSGKALKGVGFPDASPRATHQAVCQILARHFVAGHYQTAALRRQRQLAGARRASALGGLMVLLIATVLSAANIRSGLRAMETLQTLERDAPDLPPYQITSHQITPETNPLPPNAENPGRPFPDAWSGARMLEAVNLVERLPLSATPALLMLETSAALADAPAIQIDVLEWNGPASGGAADCREWATLKGRHTNFFGRYASSMEAIEQFVAALLRSAHIAEVVPMRLPVGASTERVVVARKDTRTPQPDIEFSLRVAILPTGCET